MNYYDSLPKLFFNVHQAVIGTDGKTIIFANPSAEAAFGSGLAGCGAAELLPRELLENKDGDYICAASIRGKPASISVLKDGELFIFFIELIQSGNAQLYMTRRIISNLRSSIMGLKLSSDHCFNKIDEGKAIPEKYISMLYHYYYKLLRTITQVDSADLIEHNDLPFSPVPTDLVKLCGDLADTASVLNAGAQIDISFSTPERELIAVVDPERMEYLLLNLLANSLKHSSPGGSIAITLKKAGDRAVISVDDDGDGIPRETLSNIFSPPSAETQDLGSEGIGLGLYIAYGIAQLHKGVLLIESREGEGTHVRVMLPLDAQPSPKFSTPGVVYSRSVSSVLTGLAEVLQNNCFGPMLED